MRITIANMFTFYNDGYVYGIEGVRDSKTRKSQVVVYNDRPFSEYSPSIMNTPRMIVMHEINETSISTAFLLDDQEQSEQEESDET